MPTNVGKILVNSCLDTYEVIIYITSLVHIITVILITQFNALCYIMHRNFARGDVAIFVRWGVVILQKIRRLATQSGSRIYVFLNIDYYVKPNVCTADDLCCVYICGYY